MPDFKCVTLPIFIRRVYLFRAINWYHHSLRNLLNPCADSFGRSVIIGICQLRRYYTTSDIGRCQIHTSDLNFIWILRQTKRKTGKSRWKRVALELELRTGGSYNTLCERDYRWDLSIVWLGGLKQPTNLHGCYLVVFTLIVNVNICF